MPSKPNQPAGSKAGKAGEADKVTWMKQWKIIIILTTSHLQGRVFIFKHTEPKPICFVRQAQGKIRTSPSQKKPQLGQEFHTVSFVAWHSIPALSSSLSTLWGWDPQYEHCGTAGWGTIRAHWRKHSRSLLCPRSRAHNGNTMVLLFLTLPPTSWGHENRN